MMKKVETIPICEKLTMTKEEAAAYSNIGINRFGRTSSCSKLSLCSLCRHKKADKAQGVRGVHQ